MDTFEIINTQNPKQIITTTGISTLEKNLIRSILPSHIVLEDDLTTTTKYLLTYKCFLTEKYVQALKWGIPIVHVDWAYDTSCAIKRYYMPRFYGLCFSMSDVSNEIFKNYFCVQGAVYQTSLFKSSDFLIACNQSDNENKENESHINNENYRNDKIEFCKKYNIPVLDTSLVFSNQYEKIMKEYNFDVISENAPNGIFYNLTFLLDNELHPKLLNFLKRLIIENNGTRVTRSSSENSIKKRKMAIQTINEYEYCDHNIDYIITNKYGYENYKDEYKDRILHYQYIFDCVENKCLLLHNSYIIHESSQNKIFENIVFCIDKTLSSQRGNNGINDTKNQVINKIIAMGGIIKNRVDSTCSYLIIKSRCEYKSYSFKPYKVVEFEWIDQCLYSMRRLKEDKYLVKQPSLNLFSKCKVVPNAKVEYKKYSTKDAVFQFTGLPSLLKEEAIEIMDTNNIKYEDCDYFKECTHLIMGTVTTSEKFLSVLSNGGWILRPDVIQILRDIKPEDLPNYNFEKYEWKVDDNLDSCDEKVVQSIRKWRERININGRPAFYKWIVKLDLENSKKESYKRVLTNGGAKVIEEGEFTHRFVPKKKDLNLPKRVYTTDFIFSYLFKK
ncbi:SMC5-SMC6 complex localization factor protein 1 [Astathelohania contejeani]|uniref:SMC5-SMC6 complex localization factor protein 1 n=1 Tax=Astathelohania contejeani TaxID=164912 RepID=A0ABQ7HZY7_9MICR|nr:SMC5-SMC6 complex localization factor protein 1 [Thelohania contejeani]